MPTCNQCATPCNCLLTEDGFRAGRGDTDGRRNTTVTGNGTADNPYVTSFQMSGEYRPPAGELRKTNSETTVNNVGESILTDSVYWESPGTVFFYYPASGLVALTVGNFHVVGASVSFAPAATGSRRMSLFGNDQDGNTYRVAGDVQHGTTGSNTILSCAGFTSGVLTPSPDVQAVFSNTNIDTWAIGVSQDSGGDLDIEEVRFWMATL